MANPGDLVRHMAMALGAHENSVLTYDRLLAADGFRTRRGRGWSAPIVTARDAALLLVAFLASPQVKAAASTVRRYLETQAYPDAAPYGDLTIAELSTLPPAHSFIDAIEHLIAASQRGEFGPDCPYSVQVSALAPGIRGEIRIAGTTPTPVMVRYVARDLASSSSDEFAATANDFEQIRRVSERTIHTLGIFLSS